MNKIITSCLVFIIALSSPLLLAIESNVFIVKDIQVKGLQRISAGTVFNYLPIKVGEEFKPEASANIVRALFKTQFFKDIRLAKEGNKLIVYVKERPAISSIEIEGNKSIETEALKKGLKDIGLSEGRVFNRSMLDKVTLELRRQFYNEGKYGVQIESDITPLERNRVAVSVNITEGETARIKNINIVGNTVFSDDELLDQLESSTSGWFTFYTKRDRYSKQKLAADLETLRSYYQDQGYIRFKIKSTQVAITPNKKDIYLTINIEEGSVYRIKDIKLAGDFILTPDKLFPDIHLRRGEKFSRKKVTASANRINATLSNNGYAFANVNSIPDIDETAHTVEMTFYVDAGKRVYVRDIHISGNSRTRDEVLRREFRQLEASWFSAKQVKLSKERLQRLGFFENVVIETPPVAGSTDQIDVNVKVKEKSSGAFTAGFGVSQTQGFVFNASIKENNFLGTGKQVSLAFNNSRANTNYLLSYTNPYYTLNGISRGFSLSYNKTDFNNLNASDFATERGRLGVNFGVPLGEFNRMGLTGDIEYIRFKVGSAASNEVLDFKEKNGVKFWNFNLGAFWLHDSRNRATFPQRGGTQRLNFNITVPGSDLKYYKISYDNRYWLPLTKYFTLSTLASVSYGDGYSSTSKLPFFVHYFAGGTGSVRGYSANSLGPKDTRFIPFPSSSGSFAIVNNIEADPIGGNVELVGSIGLKFPPPFKSMRDTARLELFLDGGNVFDTDKNGVNTAEFRYAYGLSGTWLSPLGALTLSYAFPFNNQRGDDLERFQFSFGTTF